MTDDLFFDAFWSCYPRKASKGDARKAWTKAVKLAGVDRIIAAAERYRDDPNREGAFTKLPATWLRAECWDDDPLPPKPSTNGHRPEPKPAYHEATAESLRWEEWADDKGRVHVRQVP